MKEPVGHIQVVDRDAPVPGGWIRADGSRWPKQSLPELFEVIGTTFGGDETHFHVPDMRLREREDPRPGVWYLIKAHDD